MQLNTDFTLVTNLLCAGLPKPATAVMDSILRLYAEVVSISVSILLLIIYFITSAIYRSQDQPVPVYVNVGIGKKYYGMSKRVESCLDLIFFCFPTLTISYILCPTLAHLYDYDLTVDVVDRNLIIDVIGRQWYWSYSVELVSVNSHVSNVYLTGHNNLSPVVFDSLLIDSCEYRLLAVDNELVVPVNYPFNLNITASDVIHAFSLPHWGLKVDAIPGRITKVCVKVNFIGTYRGQCSELCGAYHGFMPIVVSVVTFDEFFIWYCSHSMTSFGSGLFSVGDESAFSLALTSTLSFTPTETVRLMQIEGFDYIEFDLD